MSKEVMTKEQLPAVIEQALVTGDLSGLSIENRIYYFHWVCNSVGLNPATKPFAYLKLNGKLVLYATKDCTDQLRKIHGVSIYKLEKEQQGDEYVVTAYARDREGKEDSDMGVVTTSNLKGVDRANAMLKTVTKAKRRVTLSICGLGLLDESEVADIADAEKVPHPVDSPFEKEAKKTITEKVMEIFKGPELGDYVVPIGRKFKGVKLKDIAGPELDGYCRWLVETSNGQTSGLTSEFLETAEAYLKTLEFERV